MLNFGLVKLTMTKKWILTEIFRSENGPNLVPPVECSKLKSYPELVSSREIDFKLKPTCHDVITVTFEYGFMLSTRISVHGAITSIYQVDLLIFMPHKKGHVNDRCDID